MHFPQIAKRRGEDNDKRKWGQGAQAHQGNNMRVAEAGVQGQHMGGGWVGELPRTNFGGLGLGLGLGGCSRRRKHSPPTGTGIRLSRRSSAAGQTGVVGRASGGWPPPRQAKGQVGLQKIKPAHNPIPNANPDPTLTLTCSSCHADLASVKFASNFHLDHRYGGKHEAG